MQAQLKSLTNMVTSMNAQQVCDAECQDNRKINSLKTTYIKAKQNAAFTRCINWPARGFFIAKLVFIAFPI